MNIFKDLRTKLFITFVVIMIFILSPLFYVINIMTENSIEESYNQSNDNLALNTKEIVSNYFEGMMSLVDITARVDEISDLDIEKCDELLQYIVQNHDGIDQMYIMDHTGMQIYKTSYIETLGDRSDRLYFQKAIKGEIYVSDIIVSRSTNQPIVTISAPITKDSRIVGVLGASVNLIEINKVVNKNQVLENGYTFIVDNYGRLIIHPNDEYIKSMLNVNYLQPVQSVLSGETGQGTYIFEGVEKMVSYVPYEFTGWGILSQVPVKEVYKDINRIKSILIVSFIILISATIIISYMATGVHMRPLKVIANKIKETGKGNYIISFDKYEKDQIGIIKRSLVDMSNELSLYHDDLEKLVSFRTSELEMAKKSLEINLIEMEQIQSKLVETEKISALGRLGITLSHELNTPLGTSLTQLSYLDGYIKKVKLLVSEGKLKRSELDEFITDIDDTVVSINRLINRSIDIMKSFTKITDIKTNEEIVDVNIHDDIYIAVNDIKNLYRGINIVINCDSDYLIKSHLGSLSSIINHLILDSIHHSGLEINDLIIDIYVEEQYDDYKIIYSDNGIGIGKDISNKIFEPLFKGSLSSETTGLGLSLLYTVITNIMNGKIEFDSDYKLGARFNITLPKE